MKITRTNTLKLRRQSIRTLTPSELRAANGGRSGSSVQCGQGGSYPK